MFLELNLGTNGGHHSFKTAEEFDAWLRSEEQQWGWITQGSFPGDSDLYQRLRRPLEQLRQEFHRLRDHTADPAHREELVSFVMSAFAANGSLHSSTPAALFFADLAKTSNEEAVGAALYLLGFRHIHNTRADVAAGIAKAILYERGLSGSDVQQASLEELRTRFDRRLAELQSQGEATHATMVAQSGTFEERTKTDLAAATNALLQLRLGTEEELKHISEASQTELEARKKTLEDLVKAYRDAISLQAPVTYWTKRRSATKRWAIGFAALALVTLATGAGALYGLAAHYKIADLKAHELPPYWQIVPFVLALSMLLWALRILVRMMLAYTHQSLDAAERIAMVETYLALSSEGHVPKDEDRKLILATLFRHTPMGIIKDDASPATPFELLSRFLGGGSH